MSITWKWGWRTTLYDIDTDPKEFFKNLCFLIEFWDNIQLKSETNSTLFFVKGISIINHKKEQAFVFQLSELIMEIVSFAAVNLINDTW